MAKYKIVISDLHIGRGRVLSDGSLNVLEDFIADRQLAEFLNHYSSGNFYDAEVELVLLGDILNSIQVDYRGYFSPILTESISVEKVKSILKGHPTVVAALRAFAETPGHTVSYIVGNHDVDLIWDSAKRAFCEAVGIHIVFKNFSYQVDGIHFEHGQQYEVVNRLNPKRIFITQGLKEPIVNLPWGSHFLINFVIPMKHERPAIDKVRPLGAFIRWSFIHDFKWSLKTFIRAALYFFATRFSKSLYRTTNLITTIGILREITTFPNLVHGAAQVLEQNPDIHTVVMGHTHTARYVQFPDGREYFNSGTWTELSSLDLMNFGKGTK
jgi:UDP-2,3-diacylglucosamine pyrophosphatase LpxH